ncbi:MAG: chromate resistance exported protein [Rhodocyclales bacterium]|nr:chromate resistance exported protein [Rhodocyclales bacterium]
MTDQIELCALAVALPSSSPTPRSRTWRALKALGAGVLRDGVYVLPSSLEHLAALEDIARDVESADGTAELLSITSRDAEQAQRFIGLFSRTDAYRELIAQLAQIEAEAATVPAHLLERRLTSWQRSLEQLAAIDFYPTEAQAQARRALQSCLERLAPLVSPGEPSSVPRAITPLDIEDYQGRMWATRSRPWVDRLATAWLIQRHVDAQARFVWLESPTSCPTDALGFDFDGAAFTHVEGRVSFETVLESFGLHTRKELVRIAAVVHVLDVGGVPVIEAAGLSAILDGLRRREADDDRLLAAACQVFDALEEHFKNETGSEQ